MGISTVVELELMVSSNDTKCRTEGDYLALQSYVTTN